MLLYWQIRISRNKEKEETITYKFRKIRKLRYLCMVRIIKKITYG